MSEDTDGRKKEIDQVTGVETTGHEWDGLKELNNPAPRWWLWVFYITVIWSVAYWVLYPSWPVPGGATKGRESSVTQFEELEISQREIINRQGMQLKNFKAASFDQVMNDPKLYAFAVAGGRVAFKDNCATCHGTGGAGAPGYPNLNDDDWIWGGSVSDIYQTLLYGIRSGHEETHLSQMPAFGRDKLLSQEQISSVTDYVLSLSDEKIKSTPEAAQIFQANCASCHGPDATGLREFGAPNLRDAIWLYGGARKDVYESVFNAHGGVMPYWKGRLDENTIRQLAVYVHSLGGGEKDGQKGGTGEPAGGAE